MAWPPIRRFDTGRLRRDESTFPDNGVRAGGPIRVGLAIRGKCSQLREPTGSRPVANNGALECLAGEDHPTVTGPRVILLVPRASLRLLFVAAIALLDAGLAMAIADAIGAVGFSAVPVAAAAGPEATVSTTPVEL